MHLTNLNIEVPRRPERRELDTHWAAIQQRLSSALAEQVPAESSVAYVDYPIHGNTGDQMLMLGTEEWFRRSRFRVIGKWHVDNFRFPDLPSETIIICQPGGNMGDLYRYQRHREAIVRAYSDHRIVFLPQTIFYRSRDRLRQTADLLRRHDDLHLFVREQSSYELAEAELDTTTLTLVPDMASFLHPVNETLDCRIPKTATRYDILYLMRRDWEWTAVTPIPKRSRFARPPDVLSFINPFRGSGGPASAPETQQAICIDWHETAPLEMYQAWSSLAAVFLFGRILPARWFHRRWERLARRMFVRGVHAIQGAECLVTNRLHAHLLACMVGTPSIVLDNSYGKCSAYFDTWHSDLSFARFFDQGIVKHDELFTGIPGDGTRDLAESGGSNVS